MISRGLSSALICIGRVEAKIDDILGVKDSDKSMK